MSEQTEREDDWLDDFREETDEQLGDAPPGFLLDELLGRGGMAEVYLAHRTGPKGFSRKVVIKRIRPDKVEEQDFVERFIREASLTSQFHHPNIVEILELVTLDDAYYIVMEYLHGKNVSHLIEKLNKQGTRCPPEMAAFIAAGLSSALSYAHNFMDEDGKRHQIIHRDISPDNVMVTYAGEVKLLDFGVAKDLDGTQLTQGDKVIGKPLYLPPESLNGSPASPARDVYSLGMTLYVMLAGRPPFEMGSGPEGLAKLLVDITNSEIPPLRQFNEDIPADLEHIVMKTISKEQRSRYSASDLQNVLEGWLVQNGHNVNQSNLASFLREIVGEEAEGSSASPSKPKSQPKRLGSAKAEGGWVQKQERSSAAATADMDPDPTRMRIPSAGEPATLMYEQDDGVDEKTRSANVAAERAPRAERTKRKRDAHKGKKQGEESELDNKKLLIGAGAVAAATLLMFVIVAAVSDSDEEHDAFAERLERISESLGKDSIDDELANINVDGEAAPAPTRRRRPSRLGSKTAKLAIRCDGTIITVDGAEVGFCPDKVVPVTPGLHTVQVQTTKGRMEKKVVVEAYEVESVQLLKPRVRRKNRPVTIKAPVD